MNCNIFKVNVLNSDSVTATSGLAALELGDVARIASALKIRGREVGDLEQLQLPLTPS